MPYSVDLPQLFDSDKPGAWSVDVVWDVFRHTIDKGSPLPGIAVALEPHRETFVSVFEKIAAEHRLCTARYYRDADGAAQVNPLNLEHLTRLLHPFCRRLFQNGAHETLLDCLFYVMKSHCALNLFYRTDELDLFFPLHALGSVVGYGEFGPFIAITQHCTIGHNHGHYPTIQGGLWMGPGSAILGRSKVGRNVRLAANALVVDRDIPDDTVVFGVGNSLRFKPNDQDNRLMILDEALVSSPPAPLGHGGQSWA